MSDRLTVRAERSERAVVGVRASVPRGRQLRGRAVRQRWCCRRRLLVRHP